MKRTIIPSLIAKNQKELDERFGKVKNVSDIFQLDVMDGKFVKNKSLMFDFKIPKGKRYEAHLMMKNPKKWIEKNYRNIDTIIFHAESLKKTKDVYDLIDFIKSKENKVGIAVKPKTSVKNISQFLGFVDLALVLAVNPGSYGNKFLPTTLNKIREIRKINPELDVEVDGGINDKTISRVSVAGANRFVVGSYFQKSENIKKAFDELNRRIKAKNNEKSHAPGN